MSEPQVLLVEDDPDLAHAERIALERLGYNVSQSLDGSEAIALLGQRHFDLVCLDLMLPRTFGLDVCAFLRTQPSGASTLVLITTSRTLPLDVAQAIEAGADEVLAKPFELNQFKDRVRGLLEPESSDRRES